MVAFEKQVAAFYERIFGKTSLEARLKDINQEVEELLEYRDPANLREEAGDVVTSLYALAGEMGWKVEDLITENINKIADRAKGGKY